MGERRPSVDNRRLVSFDMSFPRLLMTKSFRVGQRSRIALAFLFLLGWTWWTPAFAPIFEKPGQEAKVHQFLKLGERLTSEIKGGATQSFNISLAKNEFAEIAVEQRGVVLLATLVDPDGRKVIELDYPAGGHGPIYLSVIATTARTYRLDILSVNTWALPTNYEVTLTSLRNSTPADQLRFKAQLAFSRGKENYTAGKYSEAIKAYEESLSHWVSIGDYHWQAATHYALSQTYGNRDRKNREKSLKETLRILGIRMAPNDWRLKASSLNDLGALLANAGENDTALSNLNRALNLYTQNADRRGQASALSNIGLVHINTGDPLRAREMLVKAAAHRKAENDKPGAANLVNNVGVTFDRFGEPDQALIYLNRALQEWEQVGKLNPDQRGRVATLLGNLATTNDKLGRWDEAFDFYDQALAKYDPADSARAATLDSKGELYAALGNPAKARECYDEALTLIAAAGKPNPDIKASILIHIGQLYLADNDFTSALKYFEEAESLKPPDSRLSDVLTNRGVALALKGDADQALEAYQKALDIQIKLKEKGADNKRRMALALQKRGEALGRLGKHNEALEDFNQALALWKTVKDRRGEGATLANIALVERDRGNLTIALARSDEAIQTVESLRTSVSSPRLRESYFATQENYYELNVDLKMQLSKTVNRSEYLVAALESAEKSRARVLLDALNEAGLSRGEFNQSPDPKLAKLLERRVNLQNKLAAKTQARTRFLNGVHTREQLATVDREINQTNEIYDALEAQIKSRNPRFSTLTRQQPATIREIQAQLDEQTILIEYLLGEVRSYVWVVTRDSIEGFELPPRSQIEGLAHRVYAALSARGKEEEGEDWAKKTERWKRAENDFAGASALLSDMILGRIAHLLGERRLVVVADGALQVLPIGVLPVPKSVGATAPVSTESGSTVQNPLFARHEIVSLPSASVLVLQRRELARRRPAPYPVAVLADPVFDKADSRVRTSPIEETKKAGKKQTTSNKKVDGAGQGYESTQSRAISEVDLSRSSGIRRLLHSLQEARDILRVVSSNQTLTALDFDASRSTFLSPELSRYRIIHLATHAIMNLRHPELSGMVFSLVDKTGRPQIGYVGLNEIYSLNLPADLVVLSACETGVGKQIRGEGVIALTRGFMHAGAERVVASLWRVDDQATAELMAEFYKQMFTNKLKPAAALRAAQLELLGRNPSRQPHFWAGFVLQGEWR